MLTGGASAKSSPTDLVTDIDRSSEALIVSSLLRARPEDGVQGEEGSSEKGSSGITWIIDPLDGTINYLYGIPVFAVSIAASLEGRSVAGVVHDPMTGEMYSASEGDGAFLDGRRLRIEARGRSLGEALVGTGFSYRALESRRPGAAAVGDPARWYATSAEGARPRWTCALWRAVASTPSTRPS